MTLLEITMYTTHKLNYFVWLILPIYLVQEVLETIPAALFKFQFTFPKLFSIRMNFSLDISFVGVVVVLYETSFKAYLPFELASSPWSMVPISKIISFVLNVLWRKQNLRLKKKQLKSNTYTLKIPKIGGKIIHEILIIKNALKGIESGWSGGS